MEQVDPDRLVFLDESGLDTRLTRTHARAPGGQRAVGRVPGGHWKRLTILGAIARDGLVAVMSIAAATSTAVFLAFLKDVLIPALHARPEALVALDNLAPHRAAAVRIALRQAGLEHRYLPAYSPDLNPIELAWSKLKGRLRSVAPRTIEALEAAIPDLLDAIRQATPALGSNTADTVQPEPQNALGRKPDLRPLLPAFVFRADSRFGTSGDPLQG